MLVPIWEYCPSVGTNLGILSQCWTQHTDIVVDILLHKVEPLGTLEVKLILKYIDPLKAIRGSIIGVPKTFSFCVECYDPSNYKIDKVKIQS